MLVLVGGEVLELVLVLVEELVEELEEVLVEVLVEVGTLLKYTLDAKV